jgi:hypothetical protein
MSHSSFNKAIIILAILLPFVGMSQDNLSKTVQVTKAYDPIIYDAEKIEFSVSSSDTILNIRGNYPYAIIPQNIATSVVLRPMPAAKINEAAYKDPKWLYVRAGAGYPLQALGDVYLHNLTPADLAYGLFYNHRSIWTSINNPNGEDIPVDELNHRGGIFFRKSWEKLSVNIDGGFSGHNVLFYGYNTTAARRASIVPAKDSLAQAYTSIYVNAGINSQDSKTSSFRYHANLSFDIFGDNGEKKFDKGRLFSMNENRFGADIVLGYAFGDGKHLVALNADGGLYMRGLKYNSAWNKWFASPIPVHNEIYNSLYGNGAGKNISDSRYIFNVTPVYSFLSAKVDVDLGVKYTAYNDDRTMKYKIYPVAGVRFKLVNEFVPYASINGEVQMNDYKSIASGNPYIAPGMNMAMRPTDYSYIIAAGAKGNIENVLAYNIYGRYSLIKDFFFFVNSGQTLPVAVSGGELTALRNNFDVVYDDVQELKAGADLKLSVGPVETTLAAEYYVYTLDKQKAAFHRPMLVADLDLRVKASRALIFNLNVHACSKSPYTNSLAFDKIYYNDAFINLSAGAEYIFTRSFSIFLNASNLLNSRTSVWQGYRLPGPGAMGGITFKF